jgi:hypothetical protein
MLAAKNKTKYEPHYPTENNREADVILFLILWYGKRFRVSKCEKMEGS